MMEMLFEVMEQIGRGDFSMATTCPDAFCKCGLKDLSNKIRNDIEGRRQEDPGGPWGTGGPMFF